LNLVPQYGGTVGGFRREVAMKLGGFNPKIITEDTELTFKLYERGWKAVYANRAECYEEAPEKILEARLRLTEFSQNHSRDEVQQKLLDELEILTSSQIGFFHAVA